MTKHPKLRIQQIIVRPMLVWDDGEELSPGPELQPIPLSLSQMEDFMKKLPLQVAALEEQSLNESLTNDKNDLSQQRKA